MKKILLIPFLLFAVLSMAACSDPNEEPLTPDQPEQPENPGGGGNDEAPSEPTDPTPGGNGRYLVLFASRSGNTERMANEIRTQLDCDILEVEPQTPTTKTTTACSPVRKRNLPLSGRAIIRQSRLRWKISRITTWYSSAILFGTAVWLLRCRLFYIIMRRNFPGNRLHYSHQAAAVAFQHR